MTDYLNAGGQQADEPPRTGRFGDDKDPNLGPDTQFKSGQSGNPAGKKKGTKNLATMIKTILNDETFIDRLAESLWRVPRE